MENTGELAWFRGEILRSILHPFDFAGSLAREHYGLAGVLVAVLAGVALSLSIDAMILASKQFSALDFLPQVLVDSVFLGVRLAVTVAGVATAGYWAARLLRGHDLTLDQAFTAFSFALAPLLLAPIGAVLVTLAPDLLPLAGAVAAFAVARAIAGVAINLRALLPPALAAVLFVVMVGTGALVMPDQLSRIRFAAYAVVPQVVGDFSATPMTGTVFEAVDLARAGGVPLATADTYADAASIVERQGLDNGFRERSVVRINGVVAVDDRYGGTYQGRRVVYRQFTAVPRTRGLALIFHYVDPAGEQAVLAEAASIAATWRIREVPR